MIQAQIRDALLADSAVAAVVGSRIYDLQLPKDISYPCIQMQRISETVDQHTGARRTVLQIDSYAETHPAAISLADTVRDVLSGYTCGTTPETVIAVVPQTLSDMSEPEARLYRVTGDYAVIWRKI